MPGFFDKTEFKWSLAVFVLLAAMELGGRYAMGVKDRQEACENAKNATATPEQRAVAAKACAT